MSLGWRLWLATIVVTAQLTTVIALAIPDPGAVGSSRRHKPVYESREWWTPEAQYVEDLPASSSPGLHVQDLTADPCWWAQEECTVPESMPVLTVEHKGTPTLSANLPCITTTDGCDLEAQAGLTAEETRSVPSMRLDDGAEKLVLDSCWWDQECTAF